MNLQCGIGHSWRDLEEWWNDFNLNMSDTKESVLMSISHQETWKIRDNVKKSTRIIHIEIFKLLQQLLFKKNQHKDGCWMLYLNTFMSGEKKVLNVSLMHAQKHQKNLWPHIFWTLWEGKLLSEVVGSSSHEITRLSAFVKTGSESSGKSRRKGPSLQLSYFPHGL